MSGSKIKKPSPLKAIINRLKKQGKVVVFTNGCFDILHYGHVRYLQEAKKKGDILVVGLNSDLSVRRIKGKGRPVVHEADRAGVLAELTSVDYITIFGEDTPLKIIKLLNPDILVKGADWKKDSIVGADFVIKGGGKVSTVKLVNGRSTTNIIQRIGKISKQECRR